MNKATHLEIAQLWKLSKGSKDICVAVLDGIVEQSHACFSGADLQRLDSLVSEPATQSLMSNHATHVASTLFGQHHRDSQVQGWSPNCKGLLIPIFANNNRPRISQLDLARAINLAVENGAHIINISGGELVEDKNAVDPLLKKAIETCRDKNVLVVAAAGNDGCECLHTPASLPNVLAVGAMDDEGKPLDFSNWGNEYRTQGILAYGQDILGAQVDGSLTRLSGTSFATPLISGIAALLLSIQHKRGISPSPTQVREALLKSAWPCNPHEGLDCRRLLVGRLNIQGAFALLFNGENLMNDTNLISDAHSETTGITPQEFGSEANEMVQTAVAPLSNTYANMPNGVSPSAACACQTNPKSSLVYALGKVGYDFGSEARRDGFTQLMQQYQKHPNPFNPEQLVDYLDKKPFESKMLIWTLNVDLTPIYAIEAHESYAETTYGLLIGALQGQIKDDDDADYVERVAIPGYLTGKTVRLYSGQVVPIISAQPRGFYYWNVNKLIDTAVSALPPDSKRTSAKLKNSLREFLNRIYYDYRNLGRSSSERALNFAATNAFQAVEAFSTHLTNDENGQFRQLANITVEKSPFCRLDSDCWDVKLAFFDPENERRAMKIVRYTIDVSDVMPVTLGDAKAWSAPRF